MVVVGVIYFERYGLDDPVGVVSVHGLGGLWGLVAVGLFASGKYRPSLFGDPVYREEFVKRYGSDGVRGLFYGDPSQLLAQWLGVLVLAFFGVGMAWLGFYISNRITPLRVTRDVELEGLDGPEMGALGYADFSLTRHA
jgi:Amt family ammonium transporter